MEDKKIKCIDCHKDFIFTAGEQEFFEEKVYSAPMRCKDCRNKRKAGKRKGSFRAMPSFDVTEKRPRINIFKLGGAYYFKL